MKRAGHAHRYANEREPDPLVLPVVVRVSRRSRSLVDAAGNSPRTNEEERLRIAIWDEV